MYAKQLSSRERSKIDAYLEVRLSKRDITRRLWCSVYSITTYMKQGVVYGKNYCGKPNATRNFDDELGLRASSRTIRRRIASCPHLLRRRYWGILRLRKNTRRSGCAFVENIWNNHGKMCGIPTKKSSTWMRQTV